MNLSRFQTQWLDTWDGMQAVIEHLAITPAAPFFSVGAYPLDRHADHAILLVGKATHKDWYMHSFLEAKAKPMQQRTEERKDATRHFLEHRSRTPLSSFWSFY